MRNFRSSLLDRFITILKEIREEIFIIPLGREIGFDFLLLVSQIILVQLSSYISLGFLVGLLSAIFQEGVHIDRLFNHRSFINNITILSWILNGLITSIWLYLFVKRSKKCLDFTVTFHVINFIFTIIHSMSFPTSFIWWVIMIVNGIQMHLIGKNLCYLKESRSIHINKRIKSNTNLEEIIVEDNLQNKKMTPNIKKKKKDITKKSKKMHVNELSSLSLEGLPTNNVRGLPSPEIKKDDEILINN